VTSGKDDIGPVQPEGEGPMVARMMKPLKRLCLALAVPVFLA
jgi:hypothetical protein